MYDYADKVHCAGFDEQWPPMCGAAAASLRHYDEQPITRTVAEFENLPADVTRCWQCASIIA